MGDISPDKIKAKLKDFVQEHGAKGYTHLDWVFPWEYIELSADQMAELLLHNPKVSTDLPLRAIYEMKKEFGSDNIRQAEELDPLFRWSSVDGASIYAFNVRDMSQTSHGLYDFYLLLRFDTANEYFGLKSKRCYDDH